MVPRSGWRKPPPGARLTDHVALGVLTQTVPPAVVAATGRLERRRLLPARVMVPYVLALALRRDPGYEEVMRYVVDGLAWETGWQDAWHVPTKAALFQASGGALHPIGRAYGQVWARAARRAQARIDGYAAPPQHVCGVARYDCRVKTRVVPYRRICQARPRCWRSQATAWWGRATPCAKKTTLCT